MAKNTSVHDTFDEYQTIDDHLITIFKSLAEGDVLNAMHFIRSIDVNFMPTKEVMQVVIFEILMKNEDIECVSLAFQYLFTIINAFPPSDRNRLFYAESIKMDSKNGLFSDLWIFFSHVVNSYLCHRGIYVVEDSDNNRDLIKYPHCKFLLDFYLKLFSVDLENLHPKRYGSSLLAELFWPSGNICLDTRIDDLLKWINDIYGIILVNQMADLLKKVHKLLNLMVKCFIEGKHNLLTDNDAFCNPSSADIAEKIDNYCKNAFIKLPNVKLFFSFLSFKYLQAKVSEKIIKQIVKHPRRTYVLTLKDIIDQCMFPKKISTKFSRQAGTSKEKEKNSRKKSLERRAVSPDDGELRTTELHEMCCENKYADLLEALQCSCHDVNTKDSTWHTPLHVACDVGSYKCVQILIRQSIEASYPIDFTAADIKGSTPLHIAVKKNNTDIARELLRNGGSELLTAADSRGYYPIDYSGNSEEMTRLLQEYVGELESGPQEAPVLKSFREYSIYLHALNCLLCSYCEIFHLYDFIWKKIDNAQSHIDKFCCHYIDQDVCSEDAELILDMPNLIDKFMQSVRKQAAKLDVNVDIELIPLQAFAASLKAS